MNDMQLIKMLLQQANEIASSGHNGWGNTMREAADLIIAKRERIFELENEAAKRAPNKCTA